MVGRSTIKTNKNVNDVISYGSWLCSQASGKANSQSQRLIWMNPDGCGFSVAFFLYARTGNVLSQKLNVCDSVKRVILLPIGCNKSVACSRCVTSRDGAPAAHRTARFTFCYLQSTPGCWGLLRIECERCILSSFLAGIQNMYLHFLRTDRLIHTTSQPSLLSSFQQAPLKEEGENKASVE